MARDGYASKFREFDKKSKEMVVVGEILKFKRFFSKEFNILH